MAGPTLHFLWQCLLPKLREETFLGWREDRRQRRCARAGSVAGEPYKPLTTLPHPLPATPTHTEFRRVRQTAAAGSGCLSPSEGAPGKFALDSGAATCTHQHPHPQPWDWIELFVRIQGQGFGPEEHPLKCGGFVCTGGEDLATRFCLNSGIWPYPSAGPPRVQAAQERALPSQTWGARFPGCSSPV